jgi:hypothetical protein
LDEGKEGRVKRLLACSLAAAAVGAVVGGATAFAGHWQTGAVVEVRPGDRIRVEGAPVGCRVVRMREFDRRVVIDCRRAGALEGTYGTFISGREAVLVRYESARTAKRVAVGVHERSSKRCR